MRITENLLAKPVQRENLSTVIIVELVQTLIVLVEIEFVIIVKYEPIYLNRLFGSRYPIYLNNRSVLKQSTIDD